MAARQNRSTGRKRPRRGGASSELRQALSGELPGRIDINRASRYDLERIEGIGPSLAEAIVSYRERRGAITDAHELREIDGLTDAMIDRIRDGTSV